MKFCIMPFFLKECLDFFIYPWRIFVLVNDCFMRNKASVSVYRPTVDIKAIKKIHHEWGR